jgi:hypothetical protein
VKAGGCLGGDGEGGGESCKEAQLGEEAADGAFHECSPDKALNHWQGMHLGY